MTFDEAVNRVFSLSPTLKIHQSEVQERAGESIQAGLLPNPIASYSVENVLGNKNWTGWKSAESRYELAQLVELGGKRAYRMSAAHYHYYAGLFGFEASKLDLLNRLLKTFIDVAAAQELVFVMQGQEKIAADILTSVSDQVEAGKASVIQKNRADIAWKRAQIILQKAIVGLEGAKERLSLFWGEPCPNFDTALFPFFEFEEPRCLNACLADLQDNPEMVQSQYDHWAAHQAWNLEKSLAVPDVTVLVGCKTLRDTGHRGMILGAAIPIPIFNRNQGNICKARAEIQKTKQRQLEIRLLLENKLSLSHQELVRSYREAKLLQTGVMADAEQTLELAREGYKQGKFEYLEILDAQRTFFEAKQHYIEALRDYHQKRADIEYLTSRENYE